MYKEIRLKKSTMIIVKNYVLDFTRLLKIVCVADKIHFTTNV